MYYFGTDFLSIGINSILLAIPEPYHEFHQYIWELVFCIVLRTFMRERFLKGFTIVSGLVIHYVMDNNADNYSSATT